MKYLYKQKINAHFLCSGTRDALEHGLCVDLILSECLITLCYEIKVTFDRTRAGMKFYFQALHMDLY